MRALCAIALVLSACDGAMPGEAEVDGGDPGDPDAGSEDGRWGTPEITFTLPATEDAYYLPDVQAAFPEVDWAHLDRLYIPAGHYRHILIQNLPSRDASRPLIITNLGGQVRIGALDHYYLFSLGGGSNWILTGRFDPISRTGDDGFPGHKGGAYANSAGTYGFLVDDDFVRDGNSGIGVGGHATNFEIEFVEVREVGFAGIVLKTDDDASAVMDGVVVHDVYVHDTGSEGFYIGSTQAQPQHAIRGLEIHHNRLLRTGTEAIQIGQLAGHVEVHHNVFGPSAIDWRAAFQRWQDGNMQIGVRSGTVDVHHNVFLGGAGTQNAIFGLAIDGDSHSPEDRVWIHDNYYAHHRSLFSYVGARGLAPMTYRFEHNTMRGHRYDYDEVYPGSAPTAMIALDVETAIEVVDNVFDAPASMHLAAPIDEPDGNGTGNASSGSGNTRAVVAPVRFRASGLPDDFDYLDLEMWTDIATLGGDAPVAYDRGTIVMHLAIPYRCDADICGAGLAPDVHADIWTELPPFPDDVRLASDSEHQGIGL